MIGYNSGSGAGHGPISGRITNGTSRQKAAQAVEYYNNNLGKARSRLAYHRQISSPTNGFSHHTNTQDALYRSNSSLELLHDPSTVECALRREYGPLSPGESFFNMLQDYRPVVLSADQRSPGPSEYLKHRLEQAPSAENAVNSLTDETDGRSSPKLKSKLAKFLGREGKVVRGEDKVSEVSSGYSSNDGEERRRRRAFVHYDCHSLTANLGYAAKVRALLLGRRRNTTTGASAASMIGSARAATPDGDSGDEDPGDGCRNDLIESCPYFRNEIGGEKERIVSLTRLTQQKSIHRPPLSCGVSILEYPPGETHWTHGTCPYEAPIHVIEDFDEDHQNWFGMDENLGPVAISIKKEKAGETSGQQSPSHSFQYRIIVRTSELLTLRGTVYEESIPNLKPSTNLKTYQTKEVLEYVTPEVSLSCLRLAYSGNQLEEQLLKLDEQGLSNQFKVGVMYCRGGQCSEEDMYNNEEAGPAFLEFLDTIGERVRLKGFDKYRAGLDNKTDSTGLYSVYSKYGDCEIMFHVSTFLPFTPNNRQQLLRKRHIGNDIVTIVFQEPGALPFTPRSIRSQFQHVFIVVRVHNPCTDHTTYSIAVTRSKEVPIFGPPIPAEAIFLRGKTFSEFLLGKIVNAEMAAHRSSKFSTMATRTRQEYLKDLATNYVSGQTVENGQKFSIISSFSSGKKKERSRTRLPLDLSVRGAICWQVVLEDATQSQLLECFLGISADTIIFIEEQSRDIVLVVPCVAVLGWSTQTSSLTLYHHQGEAATFHPHTDSSDDLIEIQQRVREVTDGCIAQEIALRRNSAGQLGFHVQPDGIVTQVEMQGLAWAGGLRVGARLVEICKVAVSTLSHDQMVDLLKTSVSVCVTVIAPLADGSPRRGCHLSDCKYTMHNYEGDYENLQACVEIPSKSTKKATAVVLSSHASNHRKKYERSFSPPRSSASSGYGTGSSSKSFAEQEKFAQHPDPHVVSNHSQTSRWYDEQGQTEDTYSTANPPPPPLPARSIVGRNGSDHVMQLARRWEEPNGRAGWGDRRAGRYGFEELNSQDFKVGEKVSNLKIGTDKGRLSKYGEKNSSLPVDCLRETHGSSDGSSSVHSDRLLNAQSEDELSHSSSSPSSRRVKVSYDNSRNHSPRNGEVRLRPGVTGRSVSNRNSANLTNSTLQEDLMKLINVDYPDPQMSSKKMEENKIGGKIATSSSCSSILDSQKMNGRHEEPPAEHKTTKNGDGVGKNGGEVILTTARPATVISNPSTASSPAPSEPHKLSKEERLSPRATQQPVTKQLSQELVSGGLPIAPLAMQGPCEVDKEWPSLVDTATRAMWCEALNQVESHNHNNSPKLSQGHSRYPLTQSSSDQRARPSQQQPPPPQRPAAEDEIRRLREEVRSLRDENRRLQEESHAAAQQLRRFTEWFFQTIDRQ